MCVWTLMVFMSSQVRLKQYMEQLQVTNTLSRCKILLFTNNATIMCIWTLKADSIVFIIWVSLLLLDSSSCTKDDVCFTWQNPYWRSYNKLLCSRWFMICLMMCSISLQQIHARDMDLYFLTCISLLFRKQVLRLCVSSLWV
jgi:hypothetical protein